MWPLAVVVSSFCTIIDLLNKTRQEWFLALLRKVFAVTGCHIYAVKKLSLRAIHKCITGLSIFCFKWITGSC